MMIENFLTSLRAIQNEDELVDFCRKKVLHGTPFIFASKEDDYYEFRKRIANNFNIDFHEIFITGSAKLGFSPYKSKDFDYDSDIDVAIVSERLFSRIMEAVHNYQMNLRNYS
ncbi:MAG: hypothetical protein AB1611_01410 [bacterium]